MQPLGPLQPAVLVTAWLTLAAWCLGEILRARLPERKSPLFEVVWPLGAALLLVHILVAFATRHDWSHDAAVAETARQTEETFGVRWGGGVWINYALTLWWWLDAFRISILRRPPNQPWVGEWIRRVLFLFLWFNAAVVFAQGPSRIVGAVACGAVALSWRKRR